MGCKDLYTNSLPIQPTPFYLNYVGCKELKVTPISGPDEDRFTLTMWDVKDIPANVIYVVDTGFTLTMWDVKYSSHLVQQGSRLPFYLNYVGCKGA